jgi:hypothetical protein
MPSFDLALSPGQCRRARPARVACPRCAAHAPPLGVHADAVRQRDSEEQVALGLLISPTSS